MPSVALATRLSTPSDSACQVATALPERIFGFADRVAHAVPAEIAAGVEGSVANDGRERVTALWMVASVARCAPCQAPLILTLPRH